jgi:hypothetical protein
MFEIIICTGVTFLFTALGIYGFRDEERGGVIALSYILMSLSSYSLFSKNCPESAVYADNDSEFQIGSNHYQRPLHVIMCVVVFEVAREGFDF